MNDLSDSKPARLAYSVNQAVQVTGVGRSVLYQHIKNGQLPIVKVGKRTVILRATLETFLSSRERRVL